MRILGISGSLRRDSHNRRLLLEAAELFPAGTELELFGGLKAVPPYDEDDDRDEETHPAVTELRDAITRADAVLIATPEHNSSVPGQLKNAIDWASRPPDQPFAGKPCAIIGAAAGMAGSARAQYDLRRSCVFLDMHPLNKPEVLIGQAQNKFDADGHLTDEAAQGFIRDLMTNLASWTRQIGRK